MYAAYFEMLTNEIKNEMFLKDDYQINIFKNKKTKPHIYLWTRFYT